MSRSWAFRVNWHQSWLKLWWRFLVELRSLILWIFCSFLRCKIRFRHWGWTLRCIIWSFWLSWCSTSWWISLPTRWCDSTKSWLSTIGVRRWLIRTNLWWWYRSDSARILKSWSFRWCWPLTWSYRWRNSWIVQTNFSRSLLSSLFQLFILILHKLRNIHFLSLWYLWISERLSKPKESLIWVVLANCSLRAIYSCV